MIKELDIWLGVWMIGHVLVVRIGHVDGCLSNIGCIVGHLVLFPPYDWSYELVIRLVANIEIGHIVGCVDCWSCVGYAKLVMSMVICQILVVRLVIWYYFRHMIGHTRIFF